MSGLRRSDGCSHSRQNRSSSQLTCRRALKPMIRSCSEGAYSHHCIPESVSTQSFLEPDHVTRVHSMDVSFTTNSDTSLANRLSPSSYTDDDYNIPYKCPVNFIQHQPVDVAAGVGPATRQQRFCKRQDVSGRGALTDSSDSSQGSPVRENDLLASQSNCQVGPYNKIYTCYSYIHNFINELHFSFSEGVIYTTLLRIVSFLVCSAKKFFLE